MSILFYILICLHILYYILIALGSLQMVDCFFLCPIDSGHQAGPFRVADPLCGIRRFGGGDFYPPHRAGGFGKHSAHLVYFSSGGAVREAPTNYSQGIFT